MNKPLGQQINAGDPPSTLSAPMETVKAVRAYKHRLDLPYRMRRAKKGAVKGDVSNVVRPGRVAPA
jgi:hypothetical protein